jgi:ABC-type nitrate/sulfonate/bicarbonate transport system permease component
MNLSPDISSTGAVSRPSPMVGANNADVPTGPSLEQGKRSAGDRRNRSRLVLGLRVLILLVVLAGWELSVDLGFISSDVVASPINVIIAGPGVLSSAEFWQALGSTAFTWAIGLGTSLVIGIPIGLVLGSFSVAYRMSRLTIDVLRTIPPVAVIPLLLLLFGANDQMALVLIIFGCVWPILLQTMYGAQQVDSQIREVTRSYRLRRSQRILSVLVPSALPFIATGIRISATMALLLAIGAELIGSAPGLGSEIFLAEQGTRTPEMYVYIVVCAILGAALNLAFLAIERRVLTWIPAHR